LSELTSAGIAFSAERKRTELGRILDHRRVRKEGKRSLFWFFYIKLGRMMEEGELEKGPMVSILYQKARNGFYSTTDRVCSTRRDFVILKVSLSLPEPEWKISPITMTVYVIKI